MIKGMTGFGSIQFSVKGIKATVELKSVNHRYLDVSYYLPTGFVSMESKIKAMLDKEIERGRLTVTMRFMQKPAQTIALNTTVVENYLGFEGQLKKKFGIKGELSLGDFLKLPGVFEIKENFLEAEDVWPVMEKALRRALKQLTMMRKAEGRSLAADLNDKIRRMTRQLKVIQLRIKEILADKRKVLNQEEFVSFQRSSDINEEITRLQHYLDELGALLRGAAAVGKKIDFIAQEMQRETNTVGSKIQDRTVSNAVIALKSKIEKIREQSQNIE
jgi:uncharacterized protein (TIGR00255 family)